jgi:FkbM family methyltransferase
MVYGVDDGSWNDVMLNGDSRFIFPKRDKYWNISALNGYEPEIRWLFERASNEECSFIDCGANMGYWAILASSEVYGCHPTMAVEPSRWTYNILKMNSQVNGSRFVAIHRAGLDVSNRRVRLYGRRHAGRSLLNSWRPAESDQYELSITIALDVAAEEHLPRDTRPELIKLDVEGSEIKAMKGARRLIGAGALIVYEDHGKDLAHSATRFLLDQGDFCVWWLGSDLVARPIRDIADVARIKQERTAGYNCFAYNSASSWKRLFT